MTKSDFFLQTDRLCFRKWCRDDIDYAIGLWGDFKVTNLFDNRGQLNDRQVRGRLLQEIENQYEIGFHICSKYWNMGFGREATQGVLKFAFNTLCASSLCAGHIFFFILSEAQKICKQLLGIDFNSKSVRHAVKVTHSFIPTPTNEEVSKWTT